MTKLESSFKTLRDKASITTNWGLLLDACGLDVSETTNIREQLKLKANKQSASLRQTVKSRQKPKEKKEPPSQSIIAFRSNHTDASTVLELLTDVFSKSEPSVMLNKLHRVELTSILQLGMSR